MKKIILAIAIILTVGMTFLSCSIINKVNDSVKYPDEYSITYEITSEDGVISLITKTVDKNGNVYFKTSETEKLYINENGAYTLYEKAVGGAFYPVGDIKYTADAVEEATSAIKEYTEKSKEKFIPTAKKDGEATVSGRACEVYKLGVGTDNNSSYHYYYVDAETGICLGVEVKQTALGDSVDYEGERFICKEFITEITEDLSDMIQ